MIKRAISGATTTLASVGSLLSKTALALLVGLFFVVATASPVAAHADLVSATPAREPGFLRRPARWCFALTSPSTFV